MENFKLNKQLILKFAIRLRNSPNYDPYKSNYRFFGEYSQSISKIIKSTFKGNVVFLINLISYQLNESESPSETYDRIVRNLKIFLVADIGSEQNTVYCYCNDGSYNCDECSEGYISCYDCDGNGVIYDDETGEPYDCEYCARDGSVACEYCGGRGYYDCSECGGEGNHSTESYAPILINCYYSLNNEFNEKYSSFAINNNTEGEIENINNFPRTKNILLTNKSFDVSYEDEGSGINFDIDKKFYNGTYILGAYNIFDPELTIYLSKDSFFVEKPYVDKIISNNFT